MTDKQENKNSFNPYVAKISDFKGVVYTQENLSEFLSNISIPLILDIGCGNGEYLVDRALKDPAHFYLGIELQYKEIYRTALKIQKTGLTNCAVARFDAKNIIALLNENMIDGAFILFPDPWPKNKQKKHRLIQVFYIKELLKKIRENGFIKIRTDNDDYFRHILKVIYDSDIKPLVQIEELSRDFHRTELAKKEYITAFERLFIRQGLLINHLLVVKG